MSHPYDHKTPGDSLLIYNMVRNRLPHILDCLPNQQFLSSFTWEIMNNLETCLEIGKQDAPGNIVGMEENYSAVQQSLIADLVSVLVIMIEAAGGWDFITGMSGNVITNAQNTFLNKAKAGSVEVGYDQFDMAKVKRIGNADLLSMYKKMAISKAASFGCIIEICDDCSLKVWNMLDSRIITPFIGITGCGGCGC